jgi:hypothetical protein
VKEILTTHCGSLPFVDISRAIDFTFLFDIPTLFTLPQLDPNQFMGRDLIYLLNIGDPQKLKLTSNYLESQVNILPFYADAFFDEFKKNKAQRFKYQLIGPYTFYKMLNLASDINRVDIGKFLLDKYSILLNTFNSYGDCLFVLDEPMLNLAHRDEVEWLNRFAKQLGSIDGVTIGFHICSKQTAETLTQLRNFSLYLDYELYTKEEIIQMDMVNFIGIDTSGSRHLPNEITFMRNKASDQCLIAPSCGLALHNQEKLSDVWHFLNQTKQLLLD